MVPPWTAFCMMTWLLRRRTSTKPCRSRIAQTSLPESARSLPNFDLDLGHEHVAGQSLFNFSGRSALEKQLQGLAKVVARVLDRVALAGDIKFGTQRHEPRTFGLNDGSESFAHGFTQ